MSREHEFEELVDRHLRNELSEPEKEKLAELLDSDSEKRRLFVELVSFEVLAGDVLRDSTSPDRELTTPNPPPIRSRSLVSGPITLVEFRRGSYRSARTTWIGSIDHYSRFIEFDASIR